jgi:PAS domain S-box-containing protein
VAFLGLATFVQHLTGVNLGIDTPLLFDRPWGRTGTMSPGRMGIPSSLSWTLAGAALILLLGGPRSRRAVAVLGTIVTGIAALSVAGYLFGADALYSVPWLTTIAIQTSSMIIAVGVGLVATVPEWQPMRGVVEDSAAGVLTRRLLPFIVVLPVALALLRLEGQRAGLYDTPMGTALLILGLVVLLCGVLWWSARAVRSHELAASTLTVRLDQSVRELEAIFRAAPVGIAVARDRACRKVAVNAAFADMLGVVEGANASLTGRNARAQPFRVLDEHGRDVPPHELPLQAAARTGRTVHASTLVIERHDGTRVIVMGSAVPVRGDDGGPEGAIAVFTDVTDEHRAASEREELLAAAETARTEAERANRAKDEFLAVLSHELRAPLNAMLGWVRILRRAGAGDAMVARAVETLERNIWTQAQVINDLLDISRIASGKFQLDRSRVDLAAVVASTVESMRPAAAGKQLTLALDLPDDRLEVEGDPARLQQVVGNLLHNAIKFTPEGGRVSVRLAREGGQAVIEVRDTGQGIETALLPHVFDRFVQSESSTTRRHGGLGLGLAIVKQLTVLHGGSVRAESDGPGRGARFGVTLPVAAPPLRREPGPTAFEARAPRRTDMSTLDVLVVEDDADSREALGLALQETGAEVRMVGSVRQALAAYAERPPDVLVSDIGMPDEDGYVLIRAIREREDGASRRTLAIAMTGFASRHDHETALRAGFDDHLGKPVEIETLLERVRVLAAARGT